ncbi:MAG TPA: DUF2782 domain-containing protein [Gammaproteobacteria bacterium]|nr:DUF2782 domain-containing protein [Gammaproteobacteria bacterium]
MPHQTQFIPLKSVSRGYHMIEYRTRGRITSLEIIREHGLNMVIRDSGGDGLFTRSDSTFASDLSIGLWKIGEWH